MRNLYSKLLLLVAPIILITACGGDGGPNGFDPVVAVVTPPPVQSNTNIANPTLVRLNNSEIAPGGARTLVWSDEFDGMRVDPNNWFFETGDGTEVGIPGWGNNELEYYLPDNAAVDNGMLIITAREEAIAGYDYTSARIATRDRIALRYGRIEARIRMPAGQGFWPAFWMLSQDSAYGIWAASGEIDIMEAVNLGGTGGNTVLGTLHHGGSFPNNVFTGNDYVVPGSATEEFHDYAIEWDATEMRWYVDDIMYAVQNSWSTPSTAFPAPFDQDFYIILNLAVGGNLPGSPNTATVFPSVMEVDYVRVYSGAP